MHNTRNPERGFIDPDALRAALAGARRGPKAVREVLARAETLKGLSLGDAATLLTVEDPVLELELLEAAGRVKREIYGRRMVLFAPLYLGNRCSNDCLYCAFRRANTDIVRRTLSLDEIELETRALLREGHKRLLVLSGEDHSEPVERLTAALERIYAVREPSPISGKPASIRRINVEVAPLSVDGFRTLKAARIGTYACFQESYDPDVYAAFHKRGPKADYLNRLTVMDRAMEAGIDDVGIGALFGLGDFRFEVLALLAHAAHLEERFGCGCHTVSVPRIEPAVGAPAAMAVPNPVSDDQFRLLVAVLRLALPYTGIILSTRENEALRDELFRYGISQISAGSRTDPGAYAAEGAQAASSGAQFQLGDHRSLAEVTRALTDSGYVPSFCTGCYRKGRTGADFMDLAKPGLIKRFCEPNALFTYAEYLADFASPEEASRARSAASLIMDSLPDAALRAKVAEGLASIEGGERDLYF